MTRLILALLALISGPAVAAEAFAPTPAEIERLPSVCKGILTGTITRQAAAPYPNFHHYCYGLNFINRADRPGQTADGRRFNLTSALGEIGYTAGKAPQGHWSLPQLHSDMGRVYMKLKDTAKAAEAYSKALGFNPRYEPAYLGLIQVYRSMGSQDAVLDLATTGLRHLPDSSRLKNVYIEAGGRKPFPTPFESAAPNDSAKAPTDHQNSASPSEPIERSLSGEGPSKAQDYAEDAPAAEEGAAGAPSGCRFCPPEEIQRRWRESFDSSGR